MHHAVAGVHIVFHVSLHELKHQSKRVVSVDDVVKKNNVGVFQILEQRYLSDGSAWRSLVVLQSDFLEGYHLSCDSTSSLEHCGICPLRQRVRTREREREKEVFFCVYRKQRQQYNYIIHHPHKLLAPKHGYAVLEYYILRV